MPSFMNAMVGKTITGVARILYEFQGVVEPDDGALEVMCGDQIVHLDGQSDGEQLRVEPDAWEDPFEGPISDENAEYIKAHGKWRRVDCSKTEPYLQLIGRKIADVRLLQNEFHRRAGARISTDLTSLWFTVEFDECHVHWTFPTGFTESRL